MSDKLVSILLPVYRAKDTLERAITSIVNQTYTNWELLIILEEASDLETKKIVNHYVLNDKRIKCIEKKGNKGVAISLNIGIEASSGDYIARMDADDYSHVDRLEKQVAYLEENTKIDVLGSFVNIFTPHGTNICELPVGGEYIKANLLFYDCLVHPSIMFRGSVIRNDKWRYDEKCIAEDYELWLRMMNVCGIENVEDCLLDYYYDGENNTSSNANVRKGVVRQILNATYNSMYGTKELWIPEPLTSYESEMSYWFDHPMVMLDVLAFLESLLNNNMGNQVINQKALCEVVADRWNSFLDASYGIKYIPSTIFRELYLNEIINESIYSSLSVVLGTNENGVIDAITEEMYKLQNMFLDIDRVVVYGVGKHSRRFIEYYNSCVKTVAFVDKYKIGESFAGYTVESPDVLKNICYDAVFVASTIFYDEIKRELIDLMGVSSEMIFPVEALRLKNAKNNNG